MNAIIDIYIYTIYKIDVDFVEEDLLLNRYIILSLG